MSISFRGSSNSSFITHDCSESEEELKQALESLDSINEVTVIKRKSLRLVSGYASTVKFNSVNSLTEYSWVQDPGARITHGNLSPLERESHLIGWNVKAVVEIETGSGINGMQVQWMTKSMGYDGAGAGQVSIYRKSPAGWENEGHITLMLPIALQMIISDKGSVSVTTMLLLKLLPKKLTVSPSNK